MPRRGRREPLGTFGSRTDLSAVATGKPQGMRQQLENAQAAVPVQQPPPPPGADRASAMAAAEAAARQTNFSPVGLRSPSARPGEPVTTGLSVGPGAGPTAMSGRAKMSEAEITLRAIAMQYPNEAMMEILEDLDRGGLAF